VNHKPLPKPLCCLYIGGLGQIPGLVESLGNTSNGHGKSSLRLRSGDSGTFKIRNVVHLTAVAVGVLGFSLSANASNSADDHLSGASQY
jgi:hypothetical protein